MSVEVDLLLQEAKESIEAAQNYRSELQQRLHGLSQARKQVRSHALPPVLLLFQVQPLGSACRGDENLSWRSLRGLPPPPSSCSAVNHTATSCFCCESSL